MKQIICDSCKNAEELKTKAGDIKSVELKIREDERESVPVVSLYADLCGDCRQEMLNKYFRQTVDNVEAVLPESLKSNFVPVDEQITEIHAT